MKKTRFIIPLLGVSTLSTILVPLTSCNKNITQHTITFSASDGVTLEGGLSVTVNEGTKWKDVTKPTVSAPGMYEQIGWYNGSEALTDETVIKSDFNAKYLAVNPTSTLNKVTVITDKSTYKDNIFLQGYTWGDFKTYYEITQDPEKEGYVFDGWYVGDTKIDDSYVFAEGQLSHTIEARFTSKTHTVTFAKTEGVTFEYDPGSVEVEHGKTWEKTYRPAWSIDTENYVKLGWYIDGEMTPLEDTTTIDKDITAKFCAIKKERAKINVTLKIDGKETTSVFYRTGTFGEFRETYGIEEEPYVKGKTFTGWFVGETQIDDNYVLPDREAITIEAKYTVNNYTVTFAVSEGAEFTEEVTPQTYQYGTTWAQIQAYIKPKFKIKDNYIGLGWYNQGGVLMTDDMVIDCDTTVTYATIKSEEMVCNVTVIIDGQETSGYIFTRGETLGKFKEYYEIVEPTKEDHNIIWRYNGEPIDNDWKFPMDTRNVTIEAKFGVKFEKDSWENICKYAEYGWSGIRNAYFGDLRDGSLVGYEKTIKLNGVNHTARVIDENHDDLANGTGKAALTFDVVELLSDQDGNAMTSYWGDQTIDYLNSTLRKNLSGSGSASGSEVWSKNVLTMIQEENPALYNGLKTVTKEVATTKNYVVTKYTDKVFALTVKELTGHIYSGKDEGRWYKYYNLNPEVVDRGGYDVNGVNHSYYLCSPMTIMLDNYYLYVDEGSRVGQIIFDQPKNKNRTIKFAFCI